MMGPVENNIEGRMKLVILIAKQPAVKRNNNSSGVIASYSTLYNQIIVNLASYNN